MFTFKVGDDNAATRLHRVSARQRLQLGIGRKPVDPVSDRSINDHLLLPTGSAAFSVVRNRPQSLLYDRRCSIRSSWIRAVDRATSSRGWHSIAPNTSPWIVRRTDESPQIPTGISKIQMHLQHQPRKNTSSTMSPDFVHENCNYTEIPISQ